MHRSHDLLLGRRSSRPRRRPNEDGVGARCRWFSALVVVLVFGGCEAPSGPSVAVEVIDPAGMNPAASGAFDRIVVDLEIDGGVTRYEAPIVDATFELPVVFESMEQRQRFDVMLEGPVERVYGASPSFVPASSGGLIRVPVQPLGACAVVAGLALDAPRHSMGLARLDTFLLALGGVDAAGDRRGGQFVDLLRLEPGGASDVGGLLGASQAVGLGALGAFAIGSTGLMLHYDFSVDPAAVTSLGLHPGAAEESSLARLVDRALVVGGVLDGSPVAQASWVDAARQQTTLVMQAARRSAAVAAVGEEAWVAGGSATGPSLERITLEGSDILDAAPAGESRFGGWLAVDPQSGRALLFGGVDELGQVRADSVLFSGCPQSCVAAAGPSWPNARRGATYVPEARLIVGGELPSDRVEHLVFAATDVYFELAAQLAIPRARPAARSTEGGALWIVGGEGPAGPRDDIESCFVGAPTPL